MAKLRKVRRGEPISAGLYNAMVEEIEQLKLLQVAPPLELRRLADGRRVISLGQQLDCCCVFELTASLTGPGSAAAKILWDQDHDGLWALDADTATITVYAPTNMDGVSGDRGLAKFDRQAGLWVIWQKDC